MILVGDILDKIKEIPANSVHCVVTSPPYWGLRDYGVDGQIGLEPTMQEYIAKMVQVFREVRRVLRKDGVCFLNLGDSYAGSGKGPGKSLNKEYHQLEHISGRNVPEDLKPKDLCGIPWRVALALQDDGWYLRSDIIWSKPNPMPESVTDRPTKAHEYIFLLTKSSKYFWDQEAVREDSPQYIRKAGGYTRQDINGKFKTRGGFAKNNTITNGRNLRTVWTIPTESFPDAHFATYPQKLVETCIKAGTSEYGCCSKCGKQWVRVVEDLDKQHWKEKRSRCKKWDFNQGHGRNDGGCSFINNKQTLGFQPSCSCNFDPIPCTVFDPFLGSGTTGLVAQKMGRSWIGIELSPQYAEMAMKRINKNNWLF